MCLSKLHKFLKLKLIKSQFHKIIKISIKILFNRRLEIQQDLSDVIISCASNVCLWLHIQSAINMNVIAWIYGCYIVDILKCT